MAALVPKTLTTKRMGKTPSLPDHRDCAETRRVLLIE
jgi:hypothetical protein